MKKQLTSKQYFQTITLTYYLQAFSLLAFSAVVYFLINNADNTTPPAADVKWVYVLPIVLLIGLATAWFLFNIQVKKIDPKMRLQDKFPKYANALILRSALLELPGLLSAIVAYMTFQAFYIGPAILIFILFIILRPSKDTIANDLKLSPKERDIMNNPDAIVSEVS